MKKTILVAALLLGACGFTPEGEAVRLAVREYGATAADAELKNLEWALCNALSVGAFKRRYGGSPAKAQAWRALCEGVTETPVAEPKQ